MRKARILLILGIWVAVLPYLGFPSMWKNILSSVSGIGLMYFSYILYREFIAKEKKEIFENFIEEDNDRVEGESTE